MTVGMMIRGKQLKHYRKLAGMTQDDLAAAVGTTKSKISKLESGKQVLDSGWAEILAKPLNVKPIDLLPDLAPEYPPHVQEALDVLMAANKATQEAWANVLKASRKGG